MLLSYNLKASAWIAIDGDLVVLWANVARAALDVNTKQREWLSQPDVERLNSVRAALVHLYQQIAEVGQYAPNKYLSVSLDELHRSNQVDAQQG